jgi:dienelactone hydrolase
MRTMDYLETRDDIDSDKIAYYGFSLGGTYAPVFTALEQRFAASVLISGGTTYRLPDEHRPANFAPYVTVPTLMIGGRYDAQAPISTYQRPILELFGTPSEDKKLYVFDGTHAPTDWNTTVREILAWFDAYLGPVQ